MSGSSATLVPLLASVRDEVRMREVMMTWKPDTVYHAAAYKRVPLVEHNPAEGIKRRARYLSRRAHGGGAQSFGFRADQVADKAVRPTNMVGASKRLAECSCRLWRRAHRAPASLVVHFGNVLGSSGSVMPFRATNS